MSWTVRMIDNPKAVSVKATGPMRLALIQEVAKEALTMAAARGVHQFLIDDRQMAPVLTTMEIHQLPDTLKRMGLGKHDRAAVVYARTSPEARDFRFFEDTAVNHGFDVRLFTDMYDAVTWLRAG